MENAMSNNEPSSGTSALSAGLAVSWRCFHCDEVFTDWGYARNHFGYSPADGAPACKTTRAFDSELYHLKKRLEQYQEEDTALHREIRRLHAERNAAVIRAEEEGYARGLRDAMADGLVTANAALSSCADKNILIRKGA